VTTVFAGQIVGIREVDHQIWLVSFLDDLSRRVWEITSNNAPEPRATAVAMAEFPTLALEVSRTNTRVNLP
jgi:hypothetical protein